MTSPHENCQMHPKLEDRSIWTVRLLVAVLSLVCYQVFFQNADLRNDMTALKGEVASNRRLIEINAEVLRTHTHMEKR